MRSIRIACLAFLPVATAAADSSGHPVERVTLEMYDAPPWVECLTEMGGAISIAKPPPIGVVDADEFAESVKAAVAPGDWDKRKGWSLQCNHGVIVVRAPGAVHRAIKRHLEILKTRPR